jgi:hypothetical protein
VPAPPEDPLVAQAFDTKKHEDLARAVEQLSPEEAQFFLEKLERAIRKRKIQVTGYLAAMGVWTIATALAIAYYGMHDGFVGWVFLVPFGFVGLVLYIFGGWANRIGRPPAMPTAVAAAKAKHAAADAAKAAAKAKPPAPAALPPAPAALPPASDASDASDAEVSKP